MQLVHVIEGGERAQMSKRRGEFVTLDELIDDIGTDAARFLMLQRSHDTTVDLDLELARSQSQENPVYYVQYAHARIASILRKAGDEAVEAALADPEATLGAAAEPSERALVKRLLELPDEVRAAADLRAPHRLCAYAMATARRLPRLLPRLPGRRRRGRGRRGREARRLRRHQARDRAHPRPARSRRAGEHVVAGGRTLVLGATGFAGRHFLDAAGAGGPRGRRRRARAGRRRGRCDLLEPGSVRAALAEARAGRRRQHRRRGLGRRAAGSDPGRRSPSTPTGVLNLLEAVRTEAPGAHVLCVSSAEVYGEPDEAAAVRRGRRRCGRVNPYADEQGGDGARSAASTRAPAACGSRSCAPSTTSAPASPTRSRPRASRARSPRPRREGARRRRARTSATSRPPGTSPTCATSSAPTRSVADTG